MDKIEQLLLHYKEEMMETVQKWVRIPSVKDEPASGAPFGIEARRALNAATLFRSSKKLPFSYKSWKKREKHISPNNSKWAR